MNRVATLCVLLMCAVPAAAQSTGPATPQTATAAATPAGAVAATTQTAASDVKDPTSDSGLVGARLLVLPLAEASGQQTTAQGFPVSSKPAQPFQSLQGFQWREAFKQYLTLLLAQHLVRLPQEWTHSELGGPFWADYVESVASLRGWHDGDSFAINYVGHPMMGAVTGLIQIQNDPAGRGVQFGKSPAYWRSRGWALAAAAIYSVQFELGPISEASIGNVGLQAGRMAWGDLVMTPLGGLGLIIAEDAIDRYLIAKVEGRMSPVKARLLRSLLNPNRSVANLIRFQVPWTRDARALPPRRSTSIAVHDPVGPSGVDPTR